MNRTTWIFLKLTLLIFLIGFGSPASAEIGIPLKIKLKSPTGDFPTESGLSARVFVLSPGSDCILRDEQFSNLTMTNGSLVIDLGSGTRGIYDPNLTSAQVYDNSKSVGSLSCVDANNAVVLSGQTFTPAVDSIRTVRIITTVSGTILTLNYNLKSAPFAVQAESVGGKDASALIVNDVTTQMNQTNLNDLLFDMTRFNNLKSFAVSGNAPSATSATTATNFSGTLAGDVSGGQGSTVVNKIKGIPVSATAPTNGQILTYNGSIYVPTTPPSAPVSTVAGRTGAITLTSSDISGLGGAATLNVGSIAGTVAAGDDSRIVSAASDLTAATAANVVSTLIKRDASGNASLQNLTAAGDINITGAVNGLARNVAIQNSPTTAGTATAYTVSYGAAMDAKITTNTTGDRVRFRVHTANTGAATLKVAGAPAANLFSQFTGLSVNANDLQVGFYDATFDGTNWLVHIPPQSFKNGAAINWAATTALTITAASVNAGDFVQCTLSTSTATAQTSTKYWTTSVLVRAGFIEVVGIRVSTPPNVTGVNCVVQK